MLIIWRDFSLPLIRFRFLLSRRVHNNGPGPALHRKRALAHKSLFRAEFSLKRAELWMDGLFANWSSADIIIVVGRSCANRTCAPSAKY